jgi:hypothetical protein
METFSKRVTHHGQPELSTSTKLEQIRTGKTIKRTKSGIAKKNIIVTGKDGSKIVKRQTEEKFEESGVKKKKRNYVMYESKLGTERNTQITKIQQKVIKKPKPVREPSPRVEERIVIKKKRHEYLDNYQYHETKVLRDKNPRKQALVEHQRLGEIMGGFYEENIYQSQILTQGTYRQKFPQRQIYSTHTIKTPKPRLKGSNSAASNARTNSTGLRNVRKTQASKPTYKPKFNRKASDNTLLQNRNRNTKNERTKSTETISKQILSRRGKNPYKTQTEIVKSFNNSRMGNHPRDLEKATTTTITKIVVERSGTFSETMPRKRKLNSTLNETQTITAISRIRGNDNKITHSRPKRDTKSESKPKRDTKSESKPKKDIRSESKPKNDTKSESKSKNHTKSESKPKKEPKEEKKKEEPVTNNKPEKISIRQKYKQKH